MAEHPLQGMMGITMDKVRDMVDSSTIIGDPIKVDAETTIIPVSRVTFGFASGGSDVGAKASKEMFGGGSGAGISISPVAFLVISPSGVRTMQLMEHAGTMTTRSVRCRSWWTSCPRCWAAANRAARQPRKRPKRRLRRRKKRMPPPTRPANK